jgi:glutamate dehydrogenase/leucine dehydrogenase
LLVHDAASGLSGVLVVDNTALGPGKGGIRMQPDLTVHEVFRLARAMTWKNALAGLPFGGAKAGIKSGATSPAEKQALVRAFARGLRQLVPSVYVAGPDMRTGEGEMAAFASELCNCRAATGKPASEGGLPHELGSTGFGVAEAAEVALEHAGIGIVGASVALEGFGNVGTFAARFLTEKGAKVVAVSDSRGAVFNKNGLDIDSLVEWKEVDKKSVSAFAGGKAISSSELFALQVDVLVPGARPDSINAGNINSIKAKIVVEAANVPVSEDIDGEAGEAMLAQKGVLVVPDFVANAGGVISSYVEFIGGDEGKMFSMVREKIRANTILVLKTAKEDGVPPREAAMGIAQKRVREAMERRAADEKKQQKLPRGD